MATEHRELRSDARDNRAKIVAVATDLIEKDGTMASLNEIAKTAGVGPATLYRHFATRDELLAEILGTWLVRVQDAADEWVVESRSDLVAWLERLANIANTYRGLSASLAASMVDAESPLSSAHRTTLSANELVFEKARAAGVIDGPVDSGTVARLVTGVAMVADSAELPAEEVGEMLSIILDGLMVRAQSAAASPAEMR